MSDESHSGMSDERARDLANGLLEKYGDLIGVQVGLETLHRSDIWIYVTFDEDDLERPVNATGFFPGEHEAFAAGAEYERQWAIDSPDEAGVVTKPIPLFIDRRQIDDG